MFFLYNWKTHINKSYLKCKTANNHGVCTSVIVKKQTLSGYK